MKNNLKKIWTILDLNQKRQFYTLIFLSKSLAPTEVASAFLLGHFCFGLIRSKFSSVPIPGSDLSLNGSDLISQGRDDKAKLKESLKETLDRLTYQKIIESDAAQSESMMNILKRVPVPNGRAIIMG